MRMPVSSARDMVVGVARAIRREMDRIFLLMTFSPASVGKMSGIRLLARKWPQFVRLDRFRQANIPSETVGKGVLKDLPRRPGVENPAGHYLLGPFRM